MLAFVAVAVVAAPLAAGVGFGDALAKGATAAVLVDDFCVQPASGATRRLNRLDGDRGLLDGTPGSTLAWGQCGATAEGQIGSWSSLSHADQEKDSIDFSSILPDQIDAAFQPRVTQLAVHLDDGTGSFGVELRAPDGSVAWSSTAGLSGGARDLAFDLPKLHAIHRLNWSVSGTATLRRLTLVAAVPSSVAALSTPQRAFLWSYGMLLGNWDRSTGLTRERADQPLAEMADVPAMGMQAAAAVAAWRLGFVARDAAELVVSGTARALLALPRTCHGLWPRYVAKGAAAPGAEWSSLGTVLAAVPLIEAEQALNLDTSSIRQVLNGVEWGALLLDDGTISRGYDAGCANRSTSGWKTFGGDAWMANLGYAAATGLTTPVSTSPPTANGSGDADELAWLLFPPPAAAAATGDWPGYRQQAVDRQVAYYAGHPCYGPRGLFGLSGAEVPDPSAVAPGQVYQSFGVGGIGPANDGTAIVGHAVAVPYEAALAAALRPSASGVAWEWLEANGLAGPLNQVESMAFADEPTCQQATWSSVKRSWTLALEALGWARALVGCSANPLYQSTWKNNFLARALPLVAPDGSACRSTLLPTVLNDARPPG
ncbi:MAG TPA: hypothetical protein VFC93_06165 [Chloroflexota bacterium]|nr:hypothetical protein [Chloroflexota bacterium]